LATRPADRSVEPEVAAAAFAHCSSCGAGVTEVDSFCGQCGAAVADDVQAARAARLASAPSLRTVVEASDSSFRLESLLSECGHWCRACGADQSAGTSFCSECGRDTGPLPARIDGDLGAVHLFRRKLRKRPALRIGAEGTVVRLLLESGELVEVEESELSPPVELDLPDDALLGLRTPNGMLLRLAEGCRARELKYEWEPDRLIDVAFDSVTGAALERLTALDAIAVGRSDLVARLDLTASEQAWLAALVAASEHDPGGVFDAIGQLPVDRYRPKLALLACVAQRARESSIDVSALAPHLARFAAGEPLARLIQRIWGLEPAGGESSAARAAADRRIVDGASLPDDLAAELRAGLDAIGGHEPELPGELRFLGARPRATIALATRRPGLVRPADVHEIPLSVVDQLIDAGAVGREVATAGGESQRYLRARLAPELLSDDEVDELGHEDERIRRAFRHGNSSALNDVESGSAAARHYRTLLSIQRRQLDSIVVDDAFPASRPAVSALRELVAAHVEGAPMSGLLSEAILADTTVWPVLVTIAGPSGLDPDPGLRERFPAFTEWLALHQAREHLFKGAWQQAVAAAGRCLDLADSEPVRDEALNLKACGLYHLGDEAGAIAALEEAIEGAYSDALLANIGIVAAGLQPEAAARHLGVLIAEAPTISMRVAAALRAVDIWSTSDREAWQNSDDSPLPDAFQEPLRELVTADLELDDFRNFVSLLAIHDAAWLQRAGSLASSPHRGTLEARFYIARAQDLGSMIEVMGAAIKQGNAPEWIFDERDSLRSAAVDILFENLDEPDSAFGSIALAMVDNAVLANEYDRLLFTALGTAGVTYHLSEQQQEVADQIVARVHELRSGWQRLDGEDRTRLDPLVELATRRVALNRMLARDRELADAIDAFNGALESGRYAAPGTHQYGEAMRRIAAVAAIARNARDDVRPWLTLVDHEGVREDLDKTVALTRDLEQRCLEILG
jgi:hypothetical protein